MISALPDYTQSQKGVLSPSEVPQRASSSLTNLANWSSWGLFLSQVNIVQKTCSNHSYCVKDDFGVSYPMG